MPCSLSGHSYPAPGPPQACTTLPARSNSITGGAGAQQSACGGFSAAYLSLLSSDRGRLVTQMWSCESAKIPATCPSIQLLGSGLGQYGSGSNFGTFGAAAAARQCGQTRTSAAPSARL